MRGTYEHCGEAHLHRYLAEFEFRYNNRSALGVEDKERAAKALKGIEGKRLTYGRIGEAQNAYAASPQALEAERKSTMTDSEVRKLFAVVQLSPDATLNRIVESAPGILSYFKRFAPSAHELA